MANVIQLKSGKCETVFDLEDLLCLVEQHMGSDARHLLEDLTAPEARYARIFLRRALESSAFFPYNKRQIEASEGDRDERKRDHGSGQSLLG